MPEFSSHVLKSDKFRIKMSVLMILIGIILTMNTNNDPVSLIEKVFRPIEIGNGTLHYAGLIPLLLIYNGLRGIRYLGKGKLSGFIKHPFIITIIVLVFSAGLNLKVVQIHKSFSPGLYSIYSNQEMKELGIKYIEDSMVEIESTLDLKNYSRDKRTFYLKLLIPSDYKDDILEKELYAISEESGDRKKFTLEGNQTLIVQALFIGNIPKGPGRKLSFSSHTKHFEFELSNDSESVTFFEKPIYK